MVNILTFVGIAVLVVLGACETTTKPRKASSSRPTKAMRSPVPTTPLAPTDSVSVLEKFKKSAPRSYNLQIPMPNLGHHSVEADFRFGGAGYSDISRFIVHTGVESISYAPTSESIKFPIPAHKGQVQHWRYWFGEKPLNNEDILVEIPPGLDVWIDDRTNYGLTVASAEFPYYLDTLDHSDERVDRPASAGTLCGNNSKPLGCVPRPKVRFKGPIPKNLVFVQKSLSEQVEVDLKAGEYSGKMTLPNFPGYQAYPKVIIGDWTYSLVQRAATLWTIEVDDRGEPHVTVSDSQD